MVPKLFRNGRYGTDGTGGFGSPPFPPTRVLYTIVIGLCAILVTCIVWYFFNSLFTQVSSVGHQIILDTGTNTTTSDAVESFYGNVATFFLLIATLGIGLFVYQRSQKRGVPVGY